MPIYHSDVDPYRSQIDGSVYECLSCGARFESDTRVESCPSCDDASVRNLSVARE
jgi:rubrerythrin